MLAQDMLKEDPNPGTCSQVFAVFPKPVNPTLVSMPAKWSCTLGDFMSGCTHFLFLPCCTYLSFLDLVTKFITGNNGAATGWWEEAEYAKWKHKTATIGYTSYQWVTLSYYIIFWFTQHYWEEYFLFNGDGCKCLKWSFCDEVSVFLNDVNSLWMCSNKLFIWFSH